MKKILSALMLLVLILSACNNPNRENSSDKNSGNSSDVSDLNQSSEVQDEETGSKPQDEKIKIVVPEGYTIAKIGMKFEELDVCTTEEFLEICQTGDFSEFSIISSREENPDRGFELEGYLFPATYDINVNDDLNNIIRYMVSTTEKRFDNSNIIAQAAESKYTLDEIITLASIIEKEAFGVDEMVNISSVLHNRLDEGMKLQCDVTIKYCTGVFEHFLPDRAEELKFVYNTYRCPALPAGPICNPGIAAINAALNPADTNYLYFVTDDEKNYYYAETYEEHLVNCEVAGIEVESEE